MRIVFLLIGAALSAVVQMAWGMLFWAVLPITSAVIEPLEEENVATSLKEESLSTGVYFHPAWPEDQSDEVAMEEYSEAHRQGPLVMVYYQREGREPMEPAVYAKGFAQFFAMAILAGVMLWMTNSPDQGYWRRVSVCLLLGLFGVAAINVGQMVWFLHPWQFEAALGGYYVGNALIIGLLMGAFVRPPKQIDV